MINWYNLTMNALWILGCAVAIATISYASWEASVQGEKFGTRLWQPHIQVTLNISGILFCAGLAGTSAVPWQSILWIVLAIGFLTQTFREIFRRVNR
jgi:hypothetical protein